ncbi:MAG: AtpZ/AtpI family protein [Acidimicrobiales bacterium]
MSDAPVPGSDPGEPPAASDLPGLGAFAVLGSTIATCLALGVVAGLWVDARWHTSPWGLLFGIVLGTVAAVVSVVKLVRRFL